jgi:hypothetical protein
VSRRCSRRGSGSWLRIRPQSAVLPTDCLSAYCNRSIATQRQAGPSANRESAISSRVSSVEGRRSTGALTPVSIPSFPHSRCARIRTRPAHCARFAAYCRPGGRFFFVEHGRSHEPGVQRWQDRLNGIQNVSVRRLQFESGYGASHRRRGL